MGDRVGYRSVVQPDGVTDDLGLSHVPEDRSKSDDPPTIEIRSFVLE